LSRLAPHQFLAYHDLSPYSAEGVTKRKTHEFKKLYAKLVLGVTGKILYGIKNKDQK